MNNNGRQRLSPFMRMPEYNLGTMPKGVPPPLQFQQQAAPLISMGDLMLGDGRPQAMPAQTPIDQELSQAYYDQPSATKKILGMPKDRFIGLMGTIAQAFGGDSPSGRMGAGLVNMADIMRQERLGLGKVIAEEAKAKREAKAQAEKEKREAIAKKKGRAPTVRTFRIGDMEVQHSFNYDTRKWEPIPDMPGKPIEKKEKKKEVPIIRTFRVGDMDVQHEYDFPTKKWKPIPDMPGKKVKPLDEEKPAMTEAQARKGLVDIAKYRQKLKATGGMDELLYHMIQQSNPELAQKMAGVDKSKLEETLNEHEEWLKTFIPRKAKKAKSFGSSNAPEGATATNPKTGEKIITKNGKWVLSE